MHSAGSRSLLLTLTSAILLMGIFALLPDGLYQRVFCRLPAELAAAYFGAECHGTSFRLRTGFEVSVTRACSGSDFFALLCGLGLAAGSRRPDGWGVLVKFGKLDILVYQPAGR